MLLVVDAGNTKITFGFFEGDRLEKVGSITCSANIGCSELKKQIKENFFCYKPDSCMIASVVDEITENLKNSISEVFCVKPIILSTEINYGIKIKSLHPEKYGADRIANAYAASKLYSERPLIVIDSGSATTFEVIDRDGELAGGLIMPGMELQLKALGEKTSKLPSLSLSNTPENINVISNDTEEAIYAGVIMAHAQAVQGLIKLCEQKLGEKAFIIGTGGNILLVDKFLNEKRIDVINPILTLEGIRQLYNLNIIAV